MPKKEIRHDVATQTEYAKMVGKTPQWVNQQIKAGNLNTLQIKGAVLIKLK